MCGKLKLLVPELDIDAALSSKMVLMRFSVLSNVPILSFRTKHTICWSDAIEEAS